MSITQLTSFRQKFSHNAQKCVHSLPRAISTVWCCSHVRLGLGPIDEKYCVSAFYSFPFDLLSEPSRKPSKNYPKPHFECSSDSKTCKMCWKIGEVNKYCVEERFASGFCFAKCGSSRRQHYSLSLSIINLSRIHSNKSMWCMRLTTAQSHMCRDAVSLWAQSTEWDLNVKMMMTTTTKNKINRIIMRITSIEIDGYFSMFFFHFYLVLVIAACMAIVGGWNKNEFHR